MSDGVRGEVAFDVASHTYWLGGHRLPSVTEVLKDVGIIDVSKYRGSARDRGSAVHAALRMIDFGLANADTYNGWEHRGYLVAWERFRHEVQATFDVIETPVGWLSLGCAGTPDRVGTLNTRPALIEIKTGGAEPWHRLQLAGYQLLLNPPRFDNETDVRDRDGYPARFRVRLRENGKYTLDSIEDEEKSAGGDREVFLAALKVATWKSS